MSEFFPFFNFVVTPPVLQAQPIKLIYAYGKTDDIRYHGGLRGTKEVNLLNYMPRTIPPDAKYVRVNVENVSKKDTIL